MHRCVRLHKIKICQAYSRFIFNLKIFEKDVINISRFGKITKEYYDLKNEVVENIKDNLKIKALDKVWKESVLF